MDIIKFGTDGWRAIVGERYTLRNIARIAEGTALYLLSKSDNPSVVIGYDCRFGGEMFTKLTSAVLASFGVKVYMSDAVASTPAVSYAVTYLKADLGVVITASHNPPLYNGFKLKGSHGGPLMDDEIKKIEDLIPAKASCDAHTISTNRYIESKQIIISDLDKIYIDRVEEVFDMDIFRKSKLNFAYDAMYGSGQFIMRKLLPDITFLHAEVNPYFDNIPPEPLARNLSEFMQLMEMSDNLDCGLAVDGDADRLGLVDSDGNFIDSHTVLLLLIQYLHKYKGMTGKVCCGFSSSVKIQKLCKHYGLELEVVKIGFKHLCGIMLKEDVLVGGEESGGIAVKGHIPERDGIWNGLLIWQFMIETGKSLSELIQEIFDITGPFAYERRDLHIAEDVKLKIVEKCKNNEFTHFGDRKVERIETLDGFKYYFDADQWLMIRPSGTEPVLRTYAESLNREEAFKILDDCEKEILG